MNIKSIIITMIIISLCGCKFRNDKLCGEKISDGKISIYNRLFSVEISSLPINPMFKIDLCKDEILFAIDSDKYVKNLIDIAYKYQDHIIITGRIDGDIILNKEDGKIYLKIHKLREYNVRKIL